MRKRYVYKIFDKLNEDTKIYIGSTFDIEKRWKQHKRDSNSKKLNADMLEFGTQDFDIEILFEGTEDEAYEKEIQLIKDLKPYYNNKRDYGGNLFINNKGEKHSQAILNENDVIDICIRVVYNRERICDVSNDYAQVTKEYIYQIISGEVWGHVKEAPRLKASEINIGRKGINNGNNKLEEKDIIDICNRVVKNGEKVSSVGRDYPQITKTQIYNIIRGESWEHVKEAPRKKVNRNFINDEVLLIRKLSFAGSSAKDIKTMYFEHKSELSINRVITGETFGNNLGPIKGVDY